MMKSLKNHLSMVLLPVLFPITVSLVLPSCTTNSSKEKSGEMIDLSVSADDFQTVPDSVKPWVYYWWLKGNVTKELITSDLEEMKKKGIGGLLLFDSRGYWDDYHGKTSHIPVPLDVKYEFMGQEWREMVKHTMQEARRLGLKMSINLANTGGSLRGPWNMKEEGPKQLIWTASAVSGPGKIAVRLETPSDRKYFRDAALMAVRIVSNGNLAEKGVDFNQGWKTVVTPTEDATLAGEVIDLNDKISNATLQWDVPEGEWRILRFGYHVIGEEGSVDILNPDAVTNYFHRMGSELLKDAGPLAGTTLTHFYNVSWEGGQPDWTVGFEDYFKKYRGYNMQAYLPILTGMSAEDRSVNERFMRDYLRTVSDCFEHNCYEVIGELCHAAGIQWHSENGGPWPRHAPMFKEADQLTFWGRNDMPQGEFWCSDRDLHKKSNVRYTAMAAHSYGHPLVAVEAFTHMGRHWTKYPAYLKPFADVNLVDGANFFIWHTFTASPVEVGKPGYEYFAGTHINTNITWWNEAGSIFDYLGRCQYLLQKGKFVADVCCYVNDKNYVTWGRAEKWNGNSPLAPAKGFMYDLLSSEVITNRLSVKDGRLVLPGGASYNMLVIDLDEPVIPVDVLQKISELVNEGATIVLGQTKPVRAPGLGNYPESDQEINRLAGQLWTNSSNQMQVRKVGKGKIYTHTTMEEILGDAGILPDFEGPFEYHHRTGGHTDIYFVSGEGKAECIFRVDGKVPEIWNPVTGQAADAVSCRSTADGRTAVLIDLPENGSAFVVFRKEAEGNHFVSLDGPGFPELSTDQGGSSRWVFWEKGDYHFTSADGCAEKVTVTTLPSREITGKWGVAFVPATGVKAFETTFNQLTRWNENADPAIRYFSGTAIYNNSFILNAEEAESPARLQFNEVHDIAHVRLNGQDMGTVWTAPWLVDMTGSLKEGTNELKIEVTNCWANRLIGDAGLPESKWTTKTNVRRVPDRSEYKSGHQAFSAEDELMPSGLVGPVRIEFGQYQQRN
ncbi:MAG: glycosyl hydrolase [Mangrovibacterium sp.]|nr:glycosyl hydrolase [Mangrovibacterium sp.]